MCHLKCPTPLYTQSPICSAQLSLLRHCHPLNIHFRSFSLIAFFLFQFFQCQLVFYIIVILPTQYFLLYQRHSLKFLTQFSLISNYKVPPKILFSNSHIINIPIYIFLHISLFIPTRIQILNIFLSIILFTCIFFLFL